MGLATVMRNPDQELRAAVLDTAYELGIRHLDTAPIYGLGTANREIGRLVSRGATDLRVVTKFGRELKTSGRSLARIQAPLRRVMRRAPALRRLVRATSGGVSDAGPPPPDSFRRSIDEQLNELSTDRLYGLLTHEVRWSDSWTAFSEEAFYSADLPVEYRGLSGPAVLLARYPAAVLGSAKMLQTPILDPLPTPATQPIKIHYATLSSISPKLLSPSRDLTQVAMELNVDLNDGGDRSGLILATALRQTKAVILLGSSNASHLRGTINSARRILDTGSSLKPVASLLEIGTDN